MNIVGVMGAIHPSYSPQIPLGPLDWHTETTSRPLHQELTSIRNSRTNSDISMQGFFRASLSPQRSRVQILTHVTSSVGQSNFSFCQGEEQERTVEKSFLRAIICIFSVFSNCPNLYPSLRSRTKVKDFLLKLPFNCFLKYFLIV